MKKMSKRQSFEKTFWECAQVQDDFWQGLFQVLVSKLSDLYVDPTSAAAFFLAACEANAREAAKQFVSDPSAFGQLKTKSDARSKATHALQSIQNGGAKSTLELCVSGLVRQRKASEQLDQLAKLSRLHFAELQSKRSRRHKRQIPASNWPGNGPVLRKRRLPPPQ